MQQVEPRPKQPSISVFQFTSFRGFLKAYAEDRKRANSHWSYAEWAKKLGLQGTASLTMVINGQRNPGPQITKALTGYFKFGDKEKRFFENLINLEKVENDSSLEYLVLQELKRLSPLKDFRFLDEQSFAVVSNWYYSAIRNMTQLKEFREDSAWIAKHLKFPVSEKQVREAIKNLLDLGLLQRKKNKLVKVACATGTTNDVPSEALKRHHEQSLQNAATAIRNTPVEQREFQGITFVFDAAKMSEAKTMIREFNRAFCKAMEVPEGTDVYQLNMQFIPLTQVHKETDK